MSVASAEPGTLEFQVQFIHPEKMLNLPVDPRSIEDHLSPVFHGADAPDVARTRGRYRQSAAAAAAELLADPVFVENLGALGLDPDDRVVAFGDSLTDDLQSWAEILGEVFRRTGGPELVNAGRSGDTTLHLRERLASVLATAPDRVIVQVGTNDGKAFTASPDRPLVSPAETAANAAILDAALRGSGARVHWVLPPLADEEVVATCTWWRDAAMVWSNDHLRATREAIASAVPVALDLEPVLADPDGGRLLLTDGLHPDRRGQLAIARALVAALATGAAE